MSRHRPHPHVAIPPPPRDPRDPWSDPGRYPPFVHSPPSTPPMPFPEPQIYRSSSQRISKPSTTQRPLTQAHRNTKSEVLLSPTPLTTHPSHSRASSVTGYSEDSSPELPVRDLSEELSDQTLQSEDGLRRFQAGDLSPNDEQWYLLAPPEARQVLSKQEITRQSIIFELIQNERDYVRDLELLSEAFIDPLRNIKPMASAKVESFIEEVFSNLNNIKEHHEIMIAALFARQRDQHPLVTSIADIILDRVLHFTTDYKTYIENYPLAEAQHLSEYKRNPRYQFFISQCSQDPRMKKREFNSLLIRPVTHLPRLQLLLDTMNKYTAPEHEDQGTLPVASGVLKEFIKSAERGIQSAREKVKYWELCESLVFTHGEGMFKQVLDLYDEHRSLHRAGNLARKAEKEVGTTWWDLHVALLDHYLLLLKPEKEKRTGNTKNNVVSRPIPLEYLRLDSFDKPPDSRKERSSSSEHTSTRSISFPSIQRSKYRPVYPFSIHHVSGKSYTLYAGSEEEREEWKRDLENAVMLRKAVVDGNKFFACNTINEGFFRPAPNVVISSTKTKYTGKITCATPLQGSDGRSFIAVGTTSGVYIAPKGTSNFHKVLQLPNVKYLQSLFDYNKFLIHSDAGLHAYSYSLLLRVAMREAPPQPLDASLEVLATQDSVVVWVQVGRVRVGEEGKMLVMFAIKSFLQLSVHQYEVLPPDKFVPSSGSGLVSFVQFGAVATVPKDTARVTSIGNYVGFCMDNGVLLAEPSKLATTTYRRRIVPEFSNLESDPEVQVLRSKCLSAKPLGLVRNMFGSGEVLLVYDDLGCYLNTKGEPMHGRPGRESGYLRWESKATSYITRGPLLLLFSPKYIEIRTINEGELVQVIEGEDIRLVHGGERGIYIARKGVERTGGGAGGVEVLVELVETKPIEDVKPASEPPVVDQDGVLWEEWDM